MKRSVESGVRHFTLYTFRYPLAKQAINILVGDLGEERVLIDAVIGGFAVGFVQDRGDLVAAAFCADLYEPERRTLVENHDQQAAADDADVDALAFAFVDTDGKVSSPISFAMLLRRRDIARRERGKACRIHIADIAVKRDRLAVTVDQEIRRGPRTRRTAGPGRFSSAETGVLV